MSQRVLNKTQFNIVSDSSDPDVHALDTFHPGFGGGRVPVGSLYWSKSDGKIANVVVQPEAQRQGVARRMYAQAQTMNPPARPPEASHITRQGGKFFKGVGGAGV